MKKMKLFLTVSTFCLAIAAVATTKTNSRVDCLSYTTDPTTGFCTRYMGISCSCLSGFGCVDGNGNQLWRFNGAASCIIPYKKL